MPDNKIKIFDKLTSAGMQGSFEEFDNYLTNNPQSVYDKLTSLGMQGSYDDFVAFAGITPQAPQRVDVSDVENNPNDISAVETKEKPSYAEWVKGVDQSRMSDDYDLEKAYNLLPYEELEAWKNDTTGNTHLRSVAENPETGQYDFLKRKDHPSLQAELDWYNSDDEDAKKFRAEGWKLDDSGDYYHYVKDNYNIPKELTAENYKIVKQRGEELETRKRELQRELDSDTEMNPMTLTQQNKLNQEISEIEKEQQALAEYREAFGKTEEARVLLADKQNQCDESEKYLDEKFDGGVRGFMKRYWASAMTMGHEGQENNEKTPQVYRDKLRYLREQENYRTAKNELRNAKKQLRLEEMRMNGEKEGFAVIRGMETANYNELIPLVGLANATAMLDLKNAIDNNEQLDESQKALLEMMRLNGEVKYLYEDNNTIFERLGQTIPEQLMFTLDFVVSGGLTGSISAGEKVAERQAVKNAAYMARHKVNSRLARFLGTRALPELEGMAAGATIQTLASPLSWASIAEDFERRYAGDIYYDEEGNLHVFDNGRSAGRSAYQSVANAWIENFTEFAGKNITKTIKLADSKMFDLADKFDKVIKKVGAGKIKDFFTIPKGLARMTQIGSAPEEVLEEELGMVMNALFGTDATSDRTYGENFKNAIHNSFLNGEQQLETILSCGVTSLLLGSGGSTYNKVMNSGYRKSINRDVERARLLASKVRGVQMNEIDNAIDDGKIKDISSFIKEMSDDNNWSKDEQTAVVNYIFSRTRQIGLEHDEETAIAEAENEARQQAQDLVNRWDGQHIYNVTYSDPKTKKTFQGTIVNGRVHYQTNEDGSYTFNPYMSSGMLVVRDSNGEMHQVSSNSVRRLNNVMTIDEQIEVQGNTLRQMLTKQFEADKIVIPTLETVWGENLVPGQTMLQGGKYTFMGKQENGLYALQNNEKGKGEEPVIYVTEKSLVELGLRENLRSAYAEQARQAADDLDFIQQLDELTEEATEKQEWDTVKAFAQSKVAFDENQAIVPESSNAKATAAYLLALAEGDTQKAADGVMQTINSIAQGQMKNEQGAGTSDNAADNVQENTNLSDADKANKTKADFYQEVLSILNDIQQGKQEAEADIALTTPVSQMAEGTQFPVMWNGQKAVAKVGKKDESGHSVVDIYNEKGKAIEVGIDDVTDEQWNEMRNAAITPQQKKRSTTKKSISYWGSAKEVLEHLEKVKNAMPEAPIRIAMKESELNDEAQAQLKQGNTVEAYYDPNAKEIVFYVPGLVKSGANIDAKVIHEVVVHYGLSKMLGKENYAKLCKMVYDELMSVDDKAKFLAYVIGEKGRMITPDAYDTLSDEQKAKWKKMAKSGMLDENTKIEDKDFTRAADEFIAFSYENKNLDEIKRKSIWQKIADFIMRLFSEQGVDLNISSDQLAEILDQAVLQSRDLLEGKRLTRDQLINQEVDNAIDFEDNEGDAEYISSNIEKTQRVLDEANNRKPQSNEKEARKEELRQIKADKKKAEEDLKFWTDVQARHEEVVKERATKKEEKVQQPVQLSEDNVKALWKELQDIDKPNDVQQFIADKLRQIIQTDDEGWKMQAKQEIIDYVSEHKDDAFAQKVLADTQEKMTPKNTTLDQVLFSLTVNHNSPYLLKRYDGSFVDPETGERLGFDHRFMGEGEGAQAHGWGSYFSEKDLRGYGGDSSVNIYYKGKPFVGDIMEDRNFISRLGQKTLDYIRYSGEVDNFGSKESVIADMDKAIKGWQEALERAKATDKNSPQQSLVRYYENTIADVKNMEQFLEDNWDDIKLESNRHHYEVEIPDGDYLEEEGVLSPEDNAWIRSELEREVLARDEDEMYKGQENTLVEELKQAFEEGVTTGKSAYGNVSTYLSGDDEASKFLHDIGFAGIHYNGKVDGSCYVIFDENDAKIVSHTRFSMSAPKEEIQGLDGYTKQEVLDAVRGDIESRINDADIDGITIKGMDLHGSRMRGDAREDSDLDVVMEYDGDISEDGLFNIINEEPIEIGGVKVDVNPIKKGKSGTLEQYMKRSRAYDVKKLNHEVETASTGEMDGGDSTRFSVSASFGGAGLTCWKTDKNGNKIPLTDKDGNFIAKVGDKTFDGNHLLTVKDLASFTGSTWNTITKMALDAGYAKKKDIDMLNQKYVDILNSFLVTGLNDNGGTANVQDRWLWLGETVFRTIAKNGDKQYSFSSDITRVCKKNEQIIKAISEMQSEVEYGITPSQIMDIYLKTFDKGWQVPCPVCYVFSRYIRNGKYATAAIKGMEKYGKHLKGGTDEEWTAEDWYDELEKLTKENEHNKRTKALISKAQKALDNIPDEVDKIGNILMNDKRGFITLTDEKRAEYMKKIDELNEKYQAAMDLYANNAMSNWIKTFAIRKNKGKWELRKDSEFPKDMEDFRQCALDLRRTAFTIHNYPSIQRLRKSGGAAAGKEITFASNNEIGEFLSGIGASNPENASNVFEKAAKSNGKNKNKDYSDAVKRLKAAFLYAQRQSLRGGQRMWSWSDNLENLMPDVAINLMQLQLVGGALQSYSKQLEGINLVARMGGYVNGSLMAKNNGYAVLSEDDVDMVDGKPVLNHDITETIDENTPKGKVKRTRILAEKGAPVYQLDDLLYTAIFDDIIGVDFYGRDGKKGLKDLNKELDKAGNIIVGMNDLHIRTCMADPRVFFIIPWHSSGASNHILQEMLSVLGTDISKFVSTDYTKMQEEKNYAKSEKGKYPPVPARVVDIWESHKNETDWVSGIGAIESGRDGKVSPTQLQYRALREAIFDGSIWKDKTKLAQAQNDEFLSQVIRKMKERGLESMTSADNDFIYPYEYWDENSTYETADINGKRYAEYCRRLGVKPKFTGEIKGEAWSEEGNFIDDQGYWKLLIDRRMYGVDGKFQDLTAVDASGFNSDLIDTDKNNEQFHITQVADDDATKGIVHDVREDEKQRFGMEHTVNYGMDVEEAMKRFNELYGYSAKELEEEAASLPAEEDAEEEEEETRFSASNMTPKNTSLDDVLFSLSVNHNSPYLLKKADGSFVDPETGERLGFDHRFMGTGEGTQTHGWGSYFSVNDIRKYGRNLKEEYYQSILSGLNPNKVFGIIQSIKSSPDKSVKDALEAMELVYGHIDGYSADELYKYYNDYKSEIDDMVKYSHHYDVEIPDNNGSNYIEEGEQMSSETLDRIVESLKEIGVPVELADSIKKGMYYKANRNGRYVYNRIADMIMPTANNFKQASKFLHDIGFTGIHYDGQIDGECYVIFDENDAKIVNHTRFSMSSPSIQEDMTPEEVEESATRFSLVTDPKEIERLDNEPKEIGYRTTTLNKDGSLGSPIAGRLGGTEKNVKPSSFELGKWERSEENPDLADENGKIRVTKPYGRGDMGLLDYNPYIHMRPNAINTQFTQAWKRPELVYIETEYPASELKGEYQAEKAVKPVGRTPWTGGDLILSRWDKPKRIVPWEEIADRWAEEFKDSGVTFDIVTPSLLPLLSERGVEILPPKKAAGSKAMAAYKEWKKGNTQTGFKSAEEELSKEGISIDNKSLLDEYGLSNVTLSQKGNVVTLTHFIANEKGKGNGTKFMNDLIKEADQNGWTLALTPDKSFGATSVSRLKDFYKKFGFRDNKGQKADLSISESMIRTPLSSKKNDIRFSIANRSQDIFISNAAKAVEGIKQDKATPEQWLKMIEKNGGLKAGEDKWLGLSDWLKEQDAKTLTKEQVLDFINENKIQIEEEQYEDIVPEADYGEVVESREYQDLESDLVTIDEDDNEVVDEERFNEMSMNDSDFAKGFEIDSEGHLEVYDPFYARRFLGLPRSINSTRLNYTTRGLKNKREVALTVPTIEPWNEDDEIHFGDAGGGRAVAWVRFGDTYTKETTKEEDDAMAVIEELNNKYDNNIWHNPNMTAEDEARKKEAYNIISNTPDNRKRVLVIDEIQSKRHQEGREHGYKNEKGLEELNKKKRILQDEFDAFEDEMLDKYGISSTSKNYSDEDKARFEDLKSRLRDIETKRGELFNKNLYGVYDAPFDKNWQELAMKRMLRLAAEEGYDKLAWTTGEQQAERYDLSKEVRAIHWDKQTAKEDGKIYVSVETDYGYPIKGDMTPQEIEAQLGKEIANKIVGGGNYGVLKDEGLKVGGEGMKGFYDQMLPAFMNKYLKKWGVKVGEVTMPQLQEGYQTMHSIDITPQMVDDVMEGQTMFSMTGMMEKRTSVADEYNRVTGANVEGVSEYVQRKENIARSFFDGLRPLKQLQRLVSKAMGRKLRDGEDAYNLATLLPSINKAEMDTADAEVYNPAAREYSNLVRQIMHNERLSYKEARKKADNYLLAKHGLERNEWFYQQSVREYEKKLRAYEEWLNNKAQEEYENYDKKDTVSFQEFTDGKKPKAPERIDKAGLTGLAKSLEEKEEDYTKVAEKVVKDFEGSYDTAKMWSLLNKLSHRILEIGYEKGLIDKDMLDELNKRFDYYVPLRGFAEGTIGDMFDYVRGTPQFMKVFQVAKGRTSKADDPMSNLRSMLQSNIVIGNHNRVMQRIYNLTVNSKTDLLRVTRPWIVYNESTDQWEETYPPISEGMTADEIDVAVNEFNERMRELARHHKAKHTTNKLDLGKKVTKYQAKEHEMVAYVNGDKVIMYVAGNPLVAQQLNGSKAKEIGVAAESLQAYTRFASVINTSLSPAFMVTNAARDIKFAMFSSFVTGGMSKMMHMGGNILRAMWVIPRLVLTNGKMGNGLVRWVSPKEAAKLEQYWHEFVSNGGETGFMQSHNAENMKRNVNDMIRNMVRNSNNKDGENAIKKYTLGIFETFGRMSEDISRFAAYYMQREAGGSVMNSITEAKNVTVNFNVKGGGNSRLASWIRSCRAVYSFFNAALQGINRMATLAKENPGKFSTAIALCVMNGFMLPWMNMMMFTLMGGDDDDWNRYQTLSEYVANHSFVLYIGDHKFVRIPYAQELAPFAAMGNIFFRQMQGWNENHSVVEQIGDMFLDLSPVQLGESKTTGGKVVKAITPTFLKPLVEAYVLNEDFTGAPIYKDYDKYAREWEKAYEGKTSKWLIDASKYLDDNTPFNINPARAEHIFKGLLGGIGRSGDKLLRFVSNGFQMSDAPFIRTLMFSSNPESYKSAVQKEYGYWANEFLPKTKAKIERMSNTDFIKFTDTEDYEVANAISVAKTGKTLIGNKVSNYSIDKEEKEYKKGRAIENPNEEQKDVLKAWSYDITENKMELIDEIVQIKYEHSGIYRKGRMDKVRDIKEKSKAKYDNENGKD